MREDIKQYVAAIVHGCASTGSWNADTVRRGVEVGMSLRRGSLKPEIGLRRPLEEASTGMSSCPPHISPSPRRRYDLSRHGRLTTERV